VNVGVLDKGTGVTRATLELGPTAASSAMTEHNRMILWAAKYITEDNNGWYLSNYAADVKNGAQKYLMRSGDRGSYRHTLLDAGVTKVDAARQRMSTV